MPLPSSESARLLPSTDQEASGQPKKFDPLGSSKHLILGSWINVLLVAIPLCFVGEYDISDHQMTLGQRMRSAGLL